MSQEVVSVECTVEGVEGGLLLRIPLAAGGQQLAPFSRIGRIEGEDLCLPIPLWMAEQLGVEAGSQVVVDNTGGRLRITRRQTSE
jgi:hypothetical protein